MKHVFFLAVVLFLSVNSYAQTGGLTDTQWQPLFAALEREDWETAEKVSSKYLDEIKPEDNDLTLARLRYMYLYSATGRISAGKSSYADVEKRLSGFAGKRIFLPARTLMQNCRAGEPFNALCKSDGTHDITVISTNRSGSAIHAVEYIKLKEKLDWPKHDGKVAGILGTIESIVPNPVKSRGAMIKIQVVDAVMNFREASKDK